MAGARVNGRSMNDSLIGHILVRLVFGKACLPRALSLEDPVEGGNMFGTLG